MTAPPEVNPPVSATHPLQRAEVTKQSRAQENGAVTPNLPMSGGPLQMAPSARRVVPPVSPIVARSGAWME